MKTTKADGNEMVAFTRHICDEFGTRYSGSPGELHAQQWVRGQLDEFCDETHLDAFEVRPGMYPMGLIKTAAACIALAPPFVALHGLLALLAVAWVGLGLVVLVSHLMFLQEWIRPLFKRATSHNAFGVVKPTGEVRRRVIFEGHTDAAKQMRMAEFEGKPPLGKFFVGLSLIFYTPVLAVVKTVASLAGTTRVFGTWGPFTWTTVDFVFFVPLVAMYPLFFFVVRGFTGDRIAPGANDNLSGAALSVAIGRYFADPARRLQHVELWVGSTGSEEIGDQGAKAFVEKYGPRGLLDDALVLTPDSAGAGARIMLVHHDKFHRAVYSRAIVDRLQRAHARVAEEWPDVVPCFVADLPFGSTDACRYVHAGYEAEGFVVVGTESKKPANWHSPADTPDNLDPAVLRGVLEMCLRFVEDVDAELRDA